MKLMKWSLLSLVVLVPSACREGANESVVGVAGEAPAAAKVVPVAKSPTLVDVAITVNEETGEFSTLIAALLAADLVDAIAAPGQRTVFAPTDAAFAALGLDATSIETVPTDVLTNILLYHVVPGRRTAADVLASERLRMLNRETTRISVRDDVAYINESAILQTDVMASNGIIHVIDAVLLP